MRIRRAVAATLALGAVLTGCGGPGPKAISSSPQLAGSVKLPDRIIGLSVKPEDITADLAKVQGAYVDSVALFGLRDGTVLRAALQVSRFNRLAKPNDPAFVTLIVNQFGTSEPQEMRLGDQAVWLSPGKLQYIFLWFSGDKMFVLTGRRDYPFVRSLARRLVEITKS